MFNPKDLYKKKKTEKSSFGDLFYGAEIKGKK